MLSQRLSSYHGHKGFAQGIMLYTTYVKVFGLIE